MNNYIYRWVKLDGSTAGYGSVMANNRIHARRIIEKQDRGIIVTKVIPAGEFDEDSLWNE